VAAPPPTAELEIGLHRLDASRYSVELRTRLPDSDADMAPVRGITGFDLEADPGVQPPVCSTLGPAIRSESRRFSLITGMRPVSNACSGEPGEVPDEEVNAHLGNPGLTNTPGRVVHQLRPTSRKKAGI
jgi:hypothetical protein